MGGADCNANEGKTTRGRGIELVALGLSQPFFENAFCFVLFSLFPRNGSSVWS